MDENDRNMTVLLILLICLTLVNAFMLWSLIDIVTRLEILSHINTYSMSL